MRCCFFRRVPATEEITEMLAVGPLEGELNGLPPRRDSNGRLLSENI
jgi:hypothetical protein